MRILIVDDDTKRGASLLAHIVGRTSLTRENVDVVTCTDAARSRLRSTYYDAIVLDVVLPKRAGEGVSHNKGLSLLEELNRQAYLKKPGKILGITAYRDDLARFRQACENFCNSVVDTSNAQWQEPIVNAINYVSSASLSRAAAQEGLMIFTVHGIRTYGEWQLRFQRLVERHSDAVRFVSYKYGYFSLISFLFPRAWDLEVN